LVILRVTIIWSSIRKEGSDDVRNEGVVQKSKQQDTDHGCIAELAYINMC